jgi:hypothetical protein
MNYEWPPTPDVAPAVLARIEAAQPVGRRPRRIALAVALAVLVPAGGALAIPDVRRWLGLEHVQIERVPGPEPRGERPPPHELGPRVSLAEAARRAGFEPIVPPALGTPRAVRERDGVITLLYGRVRLSEVQGEFGRDVLRKTLSAGERVRRVPGGVFIRGRHFYAYVDRLGEFVTGETRVAGRTLIIERGGLVLRLEGARFRAARRFLAA